MKQVAEEVMIKLVEQRKRLKMKLKIEEATEMKHKMNGLFRSWYHVIK